MSLNHTGIYGNDVAGKMLNEYYAVFSRNDPHTAAKKLDKYFHREFDDVDWPDYALSLADFMWHRGILTESVRSRALALLDSGAGLLLWEEADRRTYREREGVLNELRDRLTRPQPPAVELRLRLQKGPVFCAGDVIALQLQTADKCYIAYPNAYPSGITEEEFRAFDGKWIAIRKVQDSVVPRSDIEPTVRDIWPVFQLYGKIFDHCPDMDDLDGVLWADTGALSLQFDRRGNSGGPFGLFWCEGRMKNFHQRNYVLIGHDENGLIDALDEWDVDAYVGLGEDSIFHNGDSTLLKALLPFDPAFYACPPDEDGEELPF